MMERLRNWWIRRRARRDGTIGLYDWQKRNPELRSSGHVRVVGRHD